MLKGSLSKHIPDLIYITMLAESKNSWLHRASPWTKLFAMFLTILLIVIQRDIIVLITIYLVILCIYASAKLPLKVLKDWYFIPFLMSLTIALPLVINKPGGKNLFYINLYIFELYLTFNGLISLFILVIRMFASVTTSFTFIMTTKYKEIAYLIYKLFPTTLADIFLLTYRYIFLMMDEIGGRFNALRARGGTLLNYAKNIKNLGALIAVSIISGIDRGTRLAKAMQVRGGGSEKIYVNERVEKPGFLGLLFLFFYSVLIIGSLIFGFQNFIHILINYLNQLIKLK